MGPLDEVVVHAAGRAMRWLVRRDSNDQAILTEVLHDYRLDGVLARQVWSPQPLILDLGAHIGGFAIPAAACLPSATVIAIEMMADNVDLLRRNCQENAVTDRVIVHHAVIADAHGWWDPRNIDRAAPGNTGGTSVARCGFTPSPTQANPVPVLDIREFLRKPIDLCKIDCEGSEYRILFGADELLSNVRTIVGELHDADFAGLHTAGRPWTREALLDLLGRRFRHVTTWLRRAQPWGHTEMFCAWR